MQRKNQQKKEKKFEKILMSVLQDRIVENASQIAMGIFVFEPIEKFAFRSMKLHRRFLLALHWTQVLCELSLRESSSTRMLRKSCIGALSPKKECNRFFITETFSAR